MPIAPRAPALEEFQQSVTPAAYHHRCRALVRKLADAKSARRIIGADLHSSAVQGENLLGLPGLVPLHLGQLLLHEARVV